MSENSKLILIDNSPLFWVCYVCEVKYFVKKYKKGKMEFWLCKDCVGKINEILNA